jgi:hypothetical protein
MRTREISLLLFGALTAVGCEHQQRPDPRVGMLDARVASLEAAITALDAAARTPPAPPNEQPQPEQAAMPHSVPFEIGDVELYGGDYVAITEIRGDRASFEVGGSYVVNGKYRLATQEQASLQLLITGSDEADGKGPVSASAQTVVSKGAGEFELKKQLKHSGSLHLTFYRLGKPIGGIYFGAGEWLLEHKSWTYKPRSPRKPKGRSSVFDDR